MKLSFEDRVRGEAKLCADVTNKRDAEMWERGARWGYAQAALAQQAHGPQCNCGGLACEKMPPAQQVHPLTRGFDDDDVDRVARAIAKSDDDESGDDAFGASPFEYRALARAAICAMPQAETPTRDDVIAITRRHELDRYQKADAIMALFAPKETT